MAFLHACFTYSSTTTCIRHYLLTRGRLIHQATKNLTSHGNLATLQRQRSSSNSVGVAPRPLFKLLPLEDGLVKLNAKLKATPRATLT